MTPRRRPTEEGVVVLGKRHLAVLVLIQQLEDEERVRLDAITQEPPRVRMFLIGVPKVGKLWQPPNSPNPSRIAEFLAGLGEEFRWANTVNRIIKELRAWALLYNPANTDDAALMGDLEALVPKQSARTLTNELFTSHDPSDPIGWPESIEYDAQQQQARWETAEYSPRPASL